MSKHVSVYDAWCDGSYRLSHNLGGAGWVIQHDGAISEGFATIAPLHKTSCPHGSDIAEVTAAVHALRIIPPASVVRLRMDCQNVIDWLNAGTITAQKKRSVTPLQKIFAEAHKLLSAMREVDIIKVLEANNEHLARAHILSRKASTPGTPPSKSL